MTATVSTVASSERRAPVSMSAACTASASRSIGSSAAVGSSTRCWVWPTPTSTGVRGSRGMGAAAYGAVGGVGLVHRGRGSGGVGQVGTPGAALSGQIERYRQVPQTSASATPGNAVRRRPRPDLRGRRCAAPRRSPRDRPRRARTARGRRRSRREVLVADPQLQPEPVGDRRGEPGLEPGARVVGDPLGDHRAGLVVADLEQPVVLPDRVEPARRHEHRRRARGGSARARARASRARPATGSAARAGRRSR